VQSSNNYLAMGNPQQKTAFDLHFQGAKEQRLN